MRRTRSWLNLWLTSPLGFVLLAIGCATIVISPEPFQCPELTGEILDEYEVLVSEGRAEQLRAYVREVDKACRANSQLLKDTK